MNTITKPDPTMLEHGKAVAVRQTSPNSFGLIPATMAEAMKLAELMAGSTLIPKDLQKKPADCLMVIQQAVRWQLDPFAVAQECSVIQGKLMYSGKLVAAVVNALGNLSQRLSYEYQGEGQQRTITVSGQLRGESEPRIIDVALNKAKTTAKVWDTQPDQQLMYHGARVWARRHTPELMLGIYSREEFDDPAVAIANGTSVYNPDEDYTGGTPEKDTKPKEPKRASVRTITAAEAHDTNANAMRTELYNCSTVAELDATAVDIEGRQQYENLPQELKNIIARAYARALASLQVVHDSDDMEPRPATMSDFYDGPVVTPRGNERAPSVVSPPATSREAGEPHQSAPARVPLSERAISMREKDGIPEYLDRRK